MSASDAKHAAQQQEDRLYFLFPRTHEYVEQLIDECSHGANHGLGCLLLEMLVHRTRNEQQRETVFII
jgi:hypothetical protein